MTRCLSAVRETPTPDRLFPLLYHFEGCGELGNDDALKGEMARYYVAAGRTARLQSSHDQALRWYLAGKALFSEDLSNEDSEPAWEICRFGAECAVLSGAFDTADRLFREAEHHAPGPGARFGMEMVRLASFQARDQHETALGIGRRMLLQLGHSLPERISLLKLGWMTLKVWRRLRRRKEGAPPAPAKGVRPDDRVLKVLLPMGPSPLYLNREKLFAHIVAKGLDISLRWGDTGESPMLYLSFGFVLNRLTGRTAWGSRLAATAREIRDRYPDERLRVKEMYIAASLLEHWHAPMPRLLSIYEEGMALCRKQGDHVYYAYYAATLLNVRLMAGASLPAVLLEAREILSVLRRMKNTFGIRVVSMLVRTLGGLSTGAPAPLDPGGPPENDEADIGDGRGITTVSAYHLWYRICGAFFSGRTDLAYPLISGTSKLQKSDILFNYIRFVAALIEIDAGKSRKRARRRLSAVRRYARENPDVYRGRWLLAEGEFARVWGKPARALKCYRLAEAIFEAAPNGFFERGYLKEKAALVSDELGEGAAAEKERGQAIACFRQWGLWRREGLYGAAEPAAPAEGPFPRTGETAGELSEEVSALFSLAEKTGGAEVHAVVRDCLCWKSLMFVAEGRLHRPAAVPPLPDRMLSFADATGEVITATAGDAEKQFFDTAYFFARRPGTLVALPAGRNAAVLMVDPERPVDAETLGQMAGPLFGWLREEASRGGGPARDMETAAHPHMENCRRLQVHMREEKPYLDSKFSLKQLAADLDMPARSITDALNTCLGQNVQSFINSYRIEAVKAAIAGPENADANLLDIALAAGFNSKSAFNEAFRKQTGMTPSAWREAGASVQACATAVKGESGTVRSEP